jgi:hypothetical protein
LFRKGSNSFLKSSSSFLDLSSIADNSPEFLLELSSSFLSSSLSALSLVDISSSRVICSGAGGSEGEAQSGGKKACHKAAHKNNEAVSFEPNKELVFMVHARSLPAPHIKNRALGPGYFG